MPIVTNAYACTILAVSLIFIQMSSCTGGLFACGWVLKSSAISVIINMKVKTFRESVLDLEKSRLM